MSRFKATRISQAFCAIFILQTLGSLHLARCQADGDAEFEAVHQDIGRISGLSAQGLPQVEPKSALVARQPAHEPSQLVPPAANIAQVFEPRASSSQGRLGGSSRKPQRITLVARRDPLPSTLTTAPAQPSLIAAQLPAPPQQQQQQQQPPLLAQEQPAFTHSFEPLPPAQAPQFEPTASTVAVGPALNSFRSSASHSFTQSAPLVSRPDAGSVSARHNALIQQVAAERAAAATLIGNEPAPSGLAPLGLAPPEPRPQPQQSPLPVRLSLPSQTISAFASQAQSAPVHLAAPSTAQGHAVLPGGAAEPLVAPSFEQVLGQGCPQKGVFSWENKDFCDRYYMCTNGTFTEEACPNGLAYSQQGAVYQHCAYNWNVDCGRKKTAEPIASPGCPWQFGLFPIVQNGRCSIDYFACEWGVPETKRCSPEGLFYDDRIKGCQWADQLGCKSEALLNFKCPAEDEENPYWPYPRYYHTAQDVIVCVNEQPRLVHCTDEQLVEPSSLACVDVKPKKKKF